MTHQLDTEKVYVIKELSDLLKVPSDRRKALFAEMELALALADLAGVEAIGLDGFTWTDDGSKDQALFNQSGEELLRLEVTDAT